MIVVLGGAYQGKHDFVRSILKKADDEVLYDAHLVIEQWLKEKKSPIKEIKKLKPNVITCNDIGLGLYGNAYEEMIREEVGRVMCYATSVADEVYSVTCGIANKIK